MHHEYHDMSSASLYHTRRCMLSSGHREGRLERVSSFCQEFLMGKAQGFAQ